MIVPGTFGKFDPETHYVKSGGGQFRASICGKRVARARAWTLGGKVACEQCLAVAKRKYGVEPK